MWSKVGSAARPQSKERNMWAAHLRMRTPVAYPTEIHQRTEVEGFDVESGKITNVRPNRGTVSTGQVMIAVGGMNYDMAMKAGIELPIRCYPLQAMVTQPLKLWLHTLISSVSLHTYLVQSSRGEIVIGGGSDPYQLYSTRSTLDMKEHLAEGAVHLFPFLHGVRLLRQWAGITDMTPDYSPIMGASLLSNLWLNCVWGTWGVQGHPGSRQIHGADHRQSEGRADLRALHHGPLRHLRSAQRIGRYSREPLT